MRHYFQHITFSLIICLLFASYLNANNNHSKEGFYLKVYQNYLNQIDSFLEKMENDPPFLFKTNGFPIHGEADLGIVLSNCSVAIPVPIVTDNIKQGILSSFLYIDKNVENKEVITAKVNYSKEIFHLFSHGQPGQLWIEGKWLEGSQLRDFLKPLLKNKTHLNIYGCHFAKGEKGRAAVEYLEAALGVSIAASDDITGADGDWDLEVGKALNPISINDYQYNLQTAIKWSGYLSEDFKMAPRYIHLDEVNDRLIVVGRLITNPTYTNSLGLPYKGSTDVAVFSMSPDGTTVYWQAHFGGVGHDYPQALMTNAAGDVFIGGGTQSADFPVNGTTAPYDATQSGSFNAFVSRISADGTTLQYSTFLGDSTPGWTNSMAVDGDVVYYSATAYAGTSFPMVGNSYQSINNGDSDAVLFSLNTAVGGTAGLNWSTYFGGANGDDISQVKLGPDGQLVVAGNTESSGDGTENFPVTANAIQTPASINGVIAADIVGSFVAKFTTDGALTYSTLLFPTDAAYVSAAYETNMDIDAAGNIYVGEFYETDATAANFSSIPNNQLTLLATDFENINVISKISADLSPALEYMTVFGSSWDYAPPVMKMDNKGRLHLGLSVFKDGRAGHFETAGNLPVISSPYEETGAYGILSPSGASVEYMTNLGWRTYINGMAISAEGEVYTSQGATGPTTYFPTTPTYYDPESGTQKTVFNSTIVSSAYEGGIMVFHDPLPNDNTITDFAGGNNTFCIDGLIYQDPNEGPIIGNTPGYLSGDGSSPTHNLPDLFVSITGATITHPSPESPDAKYQWEKSYDGATWETIPGENLKVLKPESESAAATVQYRRLFITAACDTIISNIATATIAGSFALDISIADEPVYYCPGTAKSMGISITGASGNISWQWYNGFAPLTTEISPVSGSNVAAGSFTADIPTSASGGGSYRLVVSDASGCKKEAFVTIEPLTAPASQRSNIALCPGTIPAVTIGPAAANPDFDYSWTGPSSFTSTEANPTVTEIGTYTLQVKLTSDASFCVGGATSVTVASTTAHDAALTAITDSEFCQPDSPAPIGLSNTAPTGYVFQWVPGINLDDAQAYSPNFDPGSLPFSIKPISEVDYIFTALRLSDGCIFETTAMVSDTARALAQAGIDKPSCENSQVFGAPETDGLYWEWRAVATTYPGDIAALTGDAAFSMDGSSTNLGTEKFLTGGFPSHTACYTIDYELIASYVPFPTNCFTRDTVRLFYCPDCGGPWCSDLTSNATGTNGTCSGTNTIISGSSLDGLTYTWTTYSVDGVVQAANTAPQGLFEMNIDSTKGTALVTGASHSATIIADFDDTSWGWSGSNVVIYRLTANGNFGAGEIDCHRDIQVFSATDATPVIGVLDQSFCTVEAPAIRLGATGKDTPYTISGVDYTQAPNSAFDWEWTDLSGVGTVTADGTTPFPTIEPTVPTSYKVLVRDPVTGCIAIDTLFADLVTVITNAGEDITAVCDGTLVQLGSGSQSNHTYSWSPTSGLNAPIGTPNGFPSNAVKY